MKKKIKKYIIISSVPLIFIIVHTFALIYDIFTQKVSKIFPNVRELCIIIILVNTFFMIVNIRDYKNGKL